MSVATLPAVASIFLVITLAEPWRLELRNEYPEKSNFSFVRLVCTKDAFLAPAEDAEFMRNNASEVREIEGMRAEEVGKGRVVISLTQQNEGQFHCVWNGTTSNAVALAAQPSGAKQNVTEENVYVTSEGEVVMFNLSCGIQPGALRERYRVTWKQYFADSDAVIIHSTMTSFNVTLNLTLGDGPEVTYGCDVKVSHDATHNITYQGGKFRIHMTLEKQRSILATTIGVSCGIPIIVIIAMAVCVLLCARRPKKSAKLDLRARNIAMENEEECTKDKKEEPTNNEKGEKGKKQPPHVQDEFHGNNHYDLDTFSVRPSVSESNSISFSSCVFDETAYTAKLNKYIHETHTQNTPGDTTISSAFETFYNPLPIFQSENIDVFKSVEEHVEEMENCSNPHCQCHQVRFLELMKTTNSSFPEPLDHLTAVSRSSLEDLPEWVHRAYELHDCTENGVLHTDTEYGLIIDIPEGAIPRGMRLIVDIAICLNGPFHYPNKVRRVSAIVWVCVRGFQDFRFLKPVKVSLQHCVDVNSGSDFESFGLQFMKTAHSSDDSGFFTFRQADGVVEAGAGHDYLTLSTTHFCYVCLVSNIQPDTLQSIRYCLTPFHPHPAFQKDNDTIYFYVSFFLDACLATIERQCGKGLKRLNPRLFSFGRERCLAIEFVDPKNWILALECSDEIYASDVDFQHKDVQQLRREVEKEIYPPKFAIRAHSLKGARTVKVRFNFTGADRKITMDILLLREGGNAQPQKHDFPPSPTSLSTLSPSTSLATHTLPTSLAIHTPPTSLATPSPSTSHSPGGTQGTVLPLNSFMEHVAVYARTKWRFFGIMVDIPPDVLDSFPGQDGLYLFTNVFTFWARRGSPPITWEMVASVLESDTVDEKKLADDVRRKFIHSVFPQPRDVEQTTPAYSGKAKSTTDTGYKSQDSATSDMKVTDV